VAVRASVTLGMIDECDATIGWASLAAACRESDERWLNSLDGFRARSSMQGAARMKKGRLERSTDARARFNASLGV
jgi:hypothetical protein